MRSLRSAATMLSVIVLAGSSAAAIVPDPAAVETCPAYGRHLARAQTALAGGKREIALGALKDAAVALERCEEEAETFGSLLG